MNIYQYIHLERENNKYFTVIEFVAKHSACVYVIQTHLYMCMYVCICETYQTLFEILLISRNTNKYVGFHTNAIIASLYYALTP